MNHCDILWVDDFDIRQPRMVNVKVTDDMPDTEKYKDELEDYFPKKYHFRVNIYKFFLKLLLHLEDHFFQYNCAVLDINLKKGFEWIDEGDDEDEEENSNAKPLYKRPEDEEKEINLVIDILKKYNVKLKSEHAEDIKDGEYEEFYKNAGYYLYLYLLQRGMPAERICMLTGNCGANNISGDWEKLFSNAGLYSPYVFDRQECKDEEDKNETDFAKWLDGRYSNEYSFRSCAVAMSGCLWDMIEQEGIELRQVWNELWTEKEFGIESVRHILENVKRIPLRFSKDIGQEYVNIIWQLVQVWEGIKEFKFETKEDKYYRFLKTTRNWLAHRHFTSIDVTVASFLLGLSFRGLFDFTHIDDKVKSKYEEYLQWENELLHFIHIKDEEDNNFDFKSKYNKSCRETREKKDFSWITLKSFQGIMWRYKKNKNQYSIDENVYSMIHELGKSKGDVSLIDLIREFLHGLSSIYNNYSDDTFLESYNKKEERTQYNIEYKFKYRLNDSFFVGDCENKIEVKYLDSIRKTLQKAIEDEQENISKEKKNK